MNAAWADSSPRCDGQRGGAILGEGDVGVGRTTRGDRHRAAAQLDQVGELGAVGSVRHDLLDGDLDAVGDHGASALRQPARPATRR